MIRVLAVDDSAVMRNMVRISLSQAGFEVTQAKDAATALELARQSSYDLVLADVNMPGMNGIELIRALRNEEAYRHTPILMLTTESSPERTREGKEAGATGWIVKPFDPEQLVATMQRVLR